MKHSTSGSMTLEKAIAGFLNFKTAEGLSSRTIFTNQRTLEKWVEYSGNRKVSQVTERDINEYLVYMRTEYEPKRFGGSPHILSMKTIRNIWVTLSSFFSWKKMEFQIENPVKNILAPKFPKTVTEPYTQDEFERMIKACTYSREAETVRRKRFVMRRPTANRDRAIILALLDTGIRASEFCALKVGDFDAKTGRLEIRHGETGGANADLDRVCRAAQSKTKQ